MTDKMWFKVQRYFVWGGESLSRTLGALTGMFTCGPVCSVVASESLGQIARRTADRMEPRIIEIDQAIEHEDLTAFFEYSRPEC